MRKDKEKAIELRIQGKSYSTINRELGISKSTLSDWFKGVSWSESLKERLTAKQIETSREKIILMNLANKEKWDRWHEECRNEAIVEFSDLKSNPLFISGLMLYWGEGDKNLKNGKVRITNSDPEMIKIFCMFLKKVLIIPNHKITARLLLYPDLIDGPQKRFWSKLIELPIERFRKSTYIIGRHPTRRLSYGVCSIDVYSRKLKEKILKWSELYRQYLISGV
ncbi:MAG: hypothetical protein A3B10_00375 [Candidatus Doudnabacteria bacterium RIFCSPLOWO2_01_FULL_44_21]|uniref:Uncharacterized protein n=1 Tax=Candidatus Doudnabacteria bacterium RIFCSPLOWO2_01_FULL_44_21 TaxID=1817841 RepID=A0A1F5PXH0_9BACT|nr:MAG: hypothetical protein A3B10_00375 [Candidatus Doudnabacteria bacterium RIFCSPLOWO2_01_FULL_44_21]